MANKCNPEFHNGLEVEAEFLVTVLDAQGEPITTVPGDNRAMRYACCDKHLAHAIQYLATHSGMAVGRSFKHCHINIRVRRDAA